MKKLILASLLTAIVVNANAGEPPNSTFAAAITKGHISAPLPSTEENARVIEMLKKQTKSNGEITAEFDRLTLFKSQPNCGRVRMVVVQKSTKTYWPKISAAMNVCSNGLPPLRECKGSLSLVQPDARCPDGSEPVDTPEVAAAIAKSVSYGGLTIDQVRAQAAQAGGK